MTRFFDSAIRPPKGGWAYPINGELVAKYTESEILDAIRRYRKNNGTYQSEEALKNELWDYYCRREPGRCGMEKEFVPSFNVPDVTPTAQLIPAEKSSKLQGPPIWTFLNTMAVQWSSGMHNYFLATCDAIIVILECPLCRDEWRKILKESPPEGLSTRAAVCQWVNAAHNRVNAKLGKQNYSYARMITEWGAPLP